MELIVVCFLTYQDPSAFFFQFRSVYENVITSSDATCKKEAQRLRGFSFSRLYDKKDKADALKLLVSCGIDERDCRKVN